MQLNELSLFTGIGGGLLGTKLLGWRHIGYVEIDEYCQRVLEQRIKDGILDDAPIFGDIREFNRTYAKEFKGVADVITAGFPCQPFSVAGKRQGADDERNMWPATIECIRIVRPRYVLLENVPGLLAAPKLWLVALEKIQQVDIFGKANKNSLMSRLNRLIFKAFGVSYLGRIFGDLAESGYDIRWRCLSAAEVGANHRRNRLWILAYSTSGRANGESKRVCEADGRQRRSLPGKPIGSSDVADTTNSRTQGMCKRENQTPEVLADTEGIRWGRMGNSEDKGQADRKINAPDNAGENISDTATSGLPKSRPVGFGELPTEKEKGMDNRLTISNWWLSDPAERPAKSRVGRLVDGCPDRIQRLKALGNMQVPLVVRAVWGLLNDPE